MDQRDREKERQRQAETQDQRDRDTETDTEIDSDTERHIYRESHAHRKRQNINKYCRVLYYFPRDDNSILSTSEKPSCLLSGPYYWVKGKERGLLPSQRPGLVAMCTEITELLDP